VTERLDRLQLNISVNGVSGLTASDIPALSDRILQFRRRRRRA
jgi:hypothetical protein